MIWGMDMMETSDVGADVALKIRPSHLRWPNPRYNPNDDEQHYAASIGNVSFLKKA
jgi:hypothetical protein